jgi:hypothetical protein
MKRSKILSYLNYGIPDEIEGGHNCPVCAKPMQAARYALYFSAVTGVEGYTGFWCFDCRLRYHGGEGRWWKDERD